MNQESFIARENLEELKIQAAIHSQNEARDYYARAQTFRYSGYHMYYMFYSRLAEIFYRDARELMGINT